MRQLTARILCWATLASFVLLITPLLLAEEGMEIFNVKNYGATGKKRTTPRKRSSSAVDACAKPAGARFMFRPANTPREPSICAITCGSISTAGATLVRLHEPRPLR